MSKYCIEMSDSEMLVFFEFLHRILNDKYEELAGSLFEDISEEDVLCIIKNRINYIFRQNQTILAKNVRL